MKQEEETTSDKKKQEKNELVISYLTLRKYIGILGISLPIILLIGSCVVNGGNLEISISAYYHTPLREFFTITLGGMSLLLFAYNGYDVIDRWITNIAGFFGMLTAFVFTKPHEGFFNGIVYVDSYGRKMNDIQPTLHLVFAALFFLSLAYMSAKQFTKGGNPDEKKSLENRIYKCCAWIIVFVIASLMPAFISDKLHHFYSEHKIVFFGEAVCLWAFGVSWLVKGMRLEKENA